MDDELPPKDRELSRLLEELHARDAINQRFRALRVPGSQRQRSGHPWLGRMGAVLLAVAVGGAVTGGYFGLRGAPHEGTVGNGSPPAISTSPSPYTLPGYTTVTSPASCAAAASGNITDNYPLYVSDNGNSYAMVRCQVVFAGLLHPEADGCTWTTVHSSDPQIIGLLDIPLPGPPVGGTYEVYESLATGRATLSSTLRCPDGSVSARWSVTVAVGG